MQPLPKGAHPCFNRAVKLSAGRVHVPVAADCNIQCNYCNRRFDCLHESRPGVTSKLLEPEKVVPYLAYVTRYDPSLTVVGFAGPGDPLAEPEKILSIIKHVHRAFPSLLICVSTNGLNLPESAERLVRAGVTHVTITANTLNPEVGKRIYRWVRVDDQIFLGREGAEILIARQWEGIQRLKQKGMIIKVNTVVIPEINDAEIETLAKKCAQYQVDLMNLVPLLPVAGTLFATTPPLSKKEIFRLRGHAGVYVPQMTHCARCRADAVGRLFEKQSFRFEWDTSCRSAPVCAARADRQGTHYYCEGGWHSKRVCGS